MSDFEEQIRRINLMSAEAIVRSLRPPWIGTEPKWSASEVLLLLAAEREKCAKVAEGFECETRFCQCPNLSIHGAEIAKKIREMKP
jgi:hypothetical protein